MRLTSNVVSIFTGEQKEFLLINLNKANRSDWLTSNNTSLTNFITRYSPDSLFPRGKEIVYNGGIDDLFEYIDVVYEIGFYAYDFIDSYYFEMLVYNATTANYSIFKYYIIDDNANYFMSVSQPAITLHANISKSAIEGTYGNKFNLTKDNQFHKIKILLEYHYGDHYCDAGCGIYLNNVKCYLDDVRQDIISFGSVPVLTGGIVTNKTGYQLANYNKDFNSYLSDIYTRSSLSGLTQVRKDYYFSEIEYFDNNIFTSLSNDEYVLKDIIWGTGHIAHTGSYILSQLIDHEGVDLGTYIQEMIDGSTAYDSEYPIYSDDYISLTIQRDTASNQFMTIHLFSKYEATQQGRASDTFDNSLNVYFGEYNFYKESLGSPMHIYLIFYSITKARHSIFEVMFDTPTDSSGGRNAYPRMYVGYMTQSLDNPFLLPDTRYTTEYNKGNKAYGNPYSVTLYECYHSDAGESYTLPPNGFDIIDSFKLKVEKDPNINSCVFDNIVTKIMDFYDGTKHHMMDSFYIQNRGWGYWTDSSGKPYLFASSYNENYWRGILALGGCIAAIPPMTKCSLCVEIEMIKSPNINYTSKIRFGFIRLHKQGDTDVYTHGGTSTDYYAKAIVSPSQFCGNPMPASNDHLIIEYLIENRWDGGYYYFIPSVQMNSEVTSRMVTDAMQFYVTRIWITGNVEFVDGTIQSG